jgi:cobalamin biosynthetic protein CobC
MSKSKRDHGGGLDAAVTRFGGTRADWLDLSTGINPTSYPIPELPKHAWTDLPDQGAQDALIMAARKFWNVPDDLGIVAASGVSALISSLPTCTDQGSFHITKPTYNEHEASFLSAGFSQTQNADTQIYVHPNNPDGKYVSADDILSKHKSMSIIDESFCDCLPQKSHVELAGRDGVVVLKGLGKFWGLAGVRLGFAIAKPNLANRIQDRIGPWAISGVAQVIGAAALNDTTWACEMRKTLHNDSMRLDKLLTQFGVNWVGGTDLFRLYDCENAQALFDRLAEQKILCRIFPYSDRWIRIGLPGCESDWAQLEHALGA